MECYAREGELAEDACDFLLDFLGDRDEGGAGW